MIGVDTNVIVRLITRDDEEQFRRAKALFANHDVFIPDTVILESEWVLRYAYGFSPEEICKALLLLLGLGNVRVMDSARLCQVIEWHGRGLDFADGLHLATSQKQTVTFQTFDKDFVSRAKGLSGCLVEEA